MTEKAAFDAEEWERIVEGPALAGMIVITSQKGGTIRESMAVGKAYAEAREKPSGTPLLDEIVSSLPSIKPGEHGSAEQLHEQALGKIREAVTTLSAKADPGEVAAYREFTLDLCQRVAEADKSGGFLGIGGERVSFNESQALEQIRAALG